MKSISIPYRLSTVIRDVSTSSAWQIWTSGFGCLTTKTAVTRSCNRPRERAVMAGSVNGPLVLRLISASIKVANRAGKIVRDVMTKGELGIVQKGINDLQTEADRSAQQCIVSSLARQFPKVEIIGEETLDPGSIAKDDWIVTDYDLDVLKLKCPEDLAAVKDEDVVVWVDPLDGTSEYTQGLLDHVTVLIGIAVRGKAVGSVIHQPFYNYQATSKADELGRTMWGLLGLGVFGITHEKPPEGQLIITTTRSHSNQIVQQALDAMDATEIVRVGGAGHKVLLLIEGKAHAYVFASSGCKKWDTCAPEVLLHCVGGCLTDIHGNSLQYHKDVQHKNGGGVLATYDKATHDFYVKKIPALVKETLPP